MKKLEHYRDNLQTLETAYAQDQKNTFVVSGIIDKFLLQFELGWKLLKELLRYEGRSEAGSGSPREILKAANVVYPFLDEALWLSMLRDRNDMTHIYNGEAAAEMVEKILKQYIPEFQKLEREITARYDGNLF